MKKYLIPIAFALSIITTPAIAQDKASKKDQKMMKHSNEMQNANRSDVGRKSAKQLRKMEKKEDRINKKAAKDK
jgi:hypothetical protein